MLKPLLALYVAFIVTSLAIALYGYYVSKSKFNTGVRSFYGYSEKIPLIGFLSVVAGALASIVLFSWGRYNTIIIILSAIVLFTQSTLSREGRINNFTSFIIKSMLFILIANHIFFNIGMNDGDGLNGMFKVFLLSVYFLASAYTFHLLDESEGLAIRVFCINMAVIGLVSIVNNNFYMAVGSLSFCGASIALARFNTAPSKFIPGHTGSEALGYILALMVSMNFFSSYSSHPLSGEYSIIAIASVNLLPAIILSKKFIFFIDNHFTSSRFFDSKGLIIGIKPVNNRNIINRISLGLASVSFISTYYGLSLTIVIYSIALASVLLFNIAIRLKTASINRTAIPLPQIHKEENMEIPMKENHESEIILN